MIAAEICAIDSVRPEESAPLLSRRAQLNGYMTTYCVYPLLLEGGNPHRSPHHI